MIPKERRKKILSIINNSVDSIKTSELASKLNVTTETIRKDLVYLDNKKLIKKFHGGAKPVAEFEERSLGLRLGESTAYKQAIAEAALEQIANCSVVFIDAGSTTSELANLLVEQSQYSNRFSQLAFVTNSFSVANILNGYVRTLFFLGGEVSNITQSTSGLWASNELDSIAMDLAFLGSSGFCSHQGPCTKLSTDALFKATVIKNSSRKIVLADHTKFTTNAIMEYAKWSEINLLITDSGITSEQKENLQSNVEIIVADVPDTVD